MSQYMLVLFIFGIIVIGSVVCILVSGSSFQRSVEDEISGLSRGAEQSVPKPIPTEKIDSLPEPVRRYRSMLYPRGESLSGS